MDDLEIKTFETILIFTNKLAEKGYNRETDNYKDVLKQLGATKIKTEKIGKKKLAYETRGCNDGWYTMFTYEAPSEIIHELERLLRINDNVIKFLTVSAEGKEYDPDPEDAGESEQPNHSSVKPVDIFDLIFGI